MPFCHSPTARLRIAVVASVALCTGIALVAQGHLSQQDSTRFQAKLAAITQYAQTPPGKATPRSTQLTDTEVNSYLKYGAGSQIPVGIVDPTLNALGEGHVSGKALVDLDAVRKQKKRTWTDPMNYLSGMLPLTASGVLTTQNGVGRFQLDSAQISGVPIPKTFLQELLSYYSKTPENPAGINLDDPFALPARIREIRVASGITTVVQ